MRGSCLRCSHCWSSQYCVPYLSWGLTLSWAPNCNYYYNYYYYYCYNTVVNWNEFSVGPENVDIEKSEISFSVAIESMLQMRK